MKGTKLYQICVSGRCKHFEQEEKYMSAEAYLEKPSQEIIDNFVKRCCESQDEFQSLSDLDPNYVVVRVNELIIS